MSVAKIRVEGVFQTNYTLLVMTPNPFRAMLDEMHRMTTWMMTFYGLFLAILLLGFCFWIWMMVHCVRKKRDNALIGWMLLLVFLNVPGAIVYFFAGRGSPTQTSTAASIKQSMVGPACIKNVEPTPGGLTVHFENGQSKRFHWMDFPKLLSAHPREREKWEIASDRRTLLWPALQVRLDYAALFPDQAC